MWLKRIFWYNMFDLQMRGKDIRLARKGVSLVIAGTIILLITDFFLWDLRFWSDKLSESDFELTGIPGAKLTGKLLGLGVLGCCYLLLMITISRKTFFEQVLKEYETMSLVQKEREAQKGKYIIVVPFALVLLLFLYLLFFRLD